MNAVSGFIFLLSLIANCQFFPLTEFDIDFQEIEKLEKSYQHCPVNCQVAMEAQQQASQVEQADEVIGGSSGFQESECQCLYFPHTMNCTGQVIEYGLRKLNLVCNISDRGTYKICRFLERLKNLVTTDQTLCGTPVSQNLILNYIRKVYQRSISISTS